MATPYSWKPHKRAQRDNLLRELLKLFATLAFLGVAGYFLFRYILKPQIAPPHSQLVDVKTMTATSRALCGDPKPDGLPVAFDMVYDPDMVAWIEDAAERFARRCPNIQVKLTAMESIDAVDAILNAKVIPTVWVPSDDLVVRYLDYRWEERSKDRLFNIEDMTPLARSPLVMLLWEDKFAVLDALDAIPDESEVDAKQPKEGAWMQTLCALVPREPGTAEVAIEDMVPGRWGDWYSPLVPPPPKKKPVVAGAKKAPPKPTYQIPFPTFEQIQSWGRVKIAHTSPTRSASGLETLYLMAFDYIVPPGERTAPADDQASRDASAHAATSRGIRPMKHLRGAFEKGFKERREALSRWLRRCEAGLEDPLQSTELLTATMFNVGATRFDGVVTYEHLVFDVLRQIDEHENVMVNMRVAYPQATIMNQHPAVFLRPGELARQDQLDAARRWIAFLRTREIQERAIEFGFRPVSFEVAIRTFESETNPFLKLRRYGVSFELELEEPPRLDGQAVKELIDLWKDATGRN